MRIGIKLKLFIKEEGLGGIRQFKDCRGMWTLSILTKCINQIECQPIEGAERLNKSKEGTDFLAAHFFV